MAADSPIEQAGRALTLPLLAVVGGMLGAVALVGSLGVAPLPKAPPEASRIASKLPRPGVLATSITPITNLASASAGLVYSGDSYEVACTVATDTVTLYPIVHLDGASSWEGPDMGYPCTLDPSIATKGTCIFPARQGSGLVWNAWKTGSGTVSSCTASGRSGPVPAGPRSGGGGGTVTEIDCGTGLSCTPDPIVDSGTIAISNTGVSAATYGSATQVPQIAVNAQGQIISASNVAISAGTVTQIGCLTGLTCTPNPITGTGTIAPTFGTGSGQVLQGGVVAGGSCTSPTSVTYNNGGQITACTSGSAAVLPVPLHCTIAGGILADGTPSYCVSYANKTDAVALAGRFDTGSSAGTWELSIAWDAAVPVGNTLSAVIQRSATVSGAVADVASCTVTVTSADGASGRKSTGICTPSGAGFLLIQVLFVDGAAGTYAGAVQLQMTRLS